MKPKTDLQKQVYKMYLEMPELSEDKKEWIRNKMFYSFIYRTKKQNECLNCNHIWHGDDVKYCPSCGHRMHRLEGRTRTARHTHYAVEITTYKGFQVVRYYFVNRWIKSGEEPRWMIICIFQHWINRDGKDTVLAVLRNGMTKWTYLEGWGIYSDLEIRNNWHSSCYYISRARIIPGRKIIPNIRRNGFKGKFYKYDPAFLFISILSDPRAETMIKTGQHSLILSTQEMDYDTWSALKICIRNNYIVEDAGLWLDHIHILQDLDKDVRSPKYVCPKDLRADHDKYLNQLRNRQEKERWEQRKAMIAEETKTYRKRMRAYLNIKIIDNDIEISVLKSVMDFYNEEKALGHCVFSNKYYNKRGSLILSAKKNGARVETIEYSLFDKEILQSRGRNNSMSQYHDDIIRIINKNKEKIIC